MRESTTRYVILGFLDSDGPLSGYDVRRAISQSVGFFWTESFGQLYPELKRLAEEGLIEAVPEKSANPRERRRYRVTSEGRRVLKEWLARPARREPLRVEFLLKLMFGRRAGVGASRRHLETVRAQQRQRAGAFAQAWAQILADEGESPDLVYAAMVLQYGREVAAMRARWAEASLKLLEVYEREGNRGVLAALGEPGGKR